MGIPLWYAILFPICMCVSLLFLIIAMKKYIIRTSPETLPEYVRKWPLVEPGLYDTNHAPLESRPYSISTRMISGLGNLLYSSAPYFNSAVILMGIIGLPLGYFAYSILISQTSTFIFAICVLGLIGFETGCLGIVLLGIYTENRHFKHGITAGLSFGGYMTAIVFWLIPVWLSTSIPSWLIVIEIFPIVTFIIHLIVVRHFNLHLQMQDIKPKKWLENYNLSEWLLFFCLCVWIICLFYSLL